MRLPLLAAAALVLSLTAAGPAPKCDAVCQAVKTMLKARLNAFEGYRGALMPGEDSEWVATQSLPGSFPCEIHGAVDDPDANWECRIGEFMEFEAVAVFEKYLASVRAARPAGWEERDGLAVYARGKDFFPPGAEHPGMSLSLGKAKNGRQRLGFYINAAEPK